MTQLTVALVLVGGVADAWAERPTSPAASLTSRLQSQGQAACGHAQAAIPGLIGSILATLPPADRTSVESTVSAQTQNGRSEAAAYDAAAAGVYLEGRMPAAAWASLEAARRGWDARRATNAGVALAVSGHADAAREFITCARAMDPGSWFAIEADAMLAYHRKDCGTAPSLIDQAVKLAPRDMNVHYSAGVVHYRCGDRAAARSELQHAVDIAPTDPVVQRALAVASAGAPSQPSALVMPAAVRRQYDEYERFAQDALAIAERWAPRLRAIESARGASSSDVDDSLANLHRTVEQKTSMLAMIAKASAQEARLGSQAWISLLDMLVRSDFETTAALYDVLSIRDPTEVSIMAAALGVAPGTLAARMNGSTDGDYAIQDELQQYEAIAKRAADAHLADGAYCAAVEPAYRKMATAVESNLNALDDGFPRAAAAYLDIWIDYALQASDYARRTIVVMHFPSAAAASAEVANLRSTYATDVHDAILGGVSSELRNDQQTIASMLRGDPGLIEGQRDIECARAPVNPKSLTEALEDLLNAAESATKFDAAFHSPDCNLEVGDFKFSCKPLAFEGVKVSGSDVVRPFVSAEDGHIRYGVDGSAATLGNDGSPTNVTEANVSESAYGVEASVGVSAWVEANAAGGADVYMEAKGNLGAGADIEGVGKLDCEFFTAKATFNLRAFAEALTR